MWSLQSTPGVSKASYRLVPKELEELKLQLEELLEKGFISRVYLLRALQYFL